MILCPELGSTQNVGMLAEKGLEFILLFPGVWKLGFIKVKYLRNVGVTGFSESTPLAKASAQVTDFYEFTFLCGMGDLFSCP